MLKNTVPTIPISLQRGFFRRTLFSRLRHVAQIYMQPLFELEAWIY